jgi:16S rRNA processing protein RimM
MSQGTSSFVCVGCITAAHGLKGNVTIRSFTEIPEDFLSYGPLVNEAGEKIPEITILHPSKEAMFVARIDDVTTREEAEKYKGLSLYIHRDALPDPEGDTYYHSDLIGLSAQDETGTSIGSVKEIHDFGAGTLLEIENKASLKTWMLPFQNETVPTINLQAGYIVLTQEALKEWGSE